MAEWLVSERLISHSDVSVGRIDSAFTADRARSMEDLDALYMGPGKKDVEIWRMLSILKGGSCSLYVTELLPDAAFGLMADKKPGSKRDLATLLDVHRRIVENLRQFLL